MNYICFSFIEMIIRRQTEWNKRIALWEDKPWLKPDYQTKPFFNDNATLVWVAEGGALKVAYMAGVLAELDQHIGVEHNGVKSVLHLMDEIVGISGGVPIVLASLSGKLHLAPEIFKILTSGEFFSLYRLAKCELMPQGVVGKQTVPPINLTFAIDSLTSMGLDLLAAQKHGINFTLMVTHAETGESIGIRNPKTMEDMRFAVDASMAIPGATGAPRNYQGELVIDGGYSYDPCALNFAYQHLKASHTLFASNSHAADINPDSGVMRRVIANALAQRPLALQAYFETAQRLRAMHDITKTHKTSRNHNRGMVTTPHHAIAENICPAQDSPFDPLEANAKKLLARIEEGRADARAILAHYIEKKPLPQFISPAPTPLEQFGTAAVNVMIKTQGLFLAAPAAMTGATLAATRFSLEIATLGIRSIPVWGHTPTGSGQTNSDVSPT